MLDGIDLDVETGEVLTIIGPSGSGKSTLLRCVNLLEPVDSGRIFEGEEITRRGADSSAIRQRIGIVPAVQPVPAPEGDRQLTLASRRIRKVPRAQAEARAQELLARVGSRRRRGSTRTSSRVGSSSAPRSRGR